MVFLDGNKDQIGRYVFLYLPIGRYNMTKETKKKSTLKGI
jgi:hypothetical protein